MPHGTVVAILQHATCSLHFHRELCKLKETRMNIPDPFILPENDVNLDDLSLA